MKQSARRRADLHPQASRAARVLLLCEQPKGASLGWLTAELRPLAALPEVIGLTFCELEQGGPWIRPGELLVEVEVARPAYTADVLDSEPLRALLAELRSLRLHPQLAVGFEPVLVEPGRVRERRSLRSETEHPSGGGVLTFGVLVASIGVLGLGAIVFVDVSGCLLLVSRVWDASPGTGSR